MNIKIKQDFTNEWQIAYCPLIGMAISNNQFKQIKQENEHLTFVKSVLNSCHYISQEIIGNKKKYLCYTVVISLTLNLEIVDYCCRLSLLAMSNHFSSDCD